MSTFPEGTIDRVKDTESYDKAAIQNICDFIAYNFPYHYYIEAKTTKQNTYNLNSLRQYDDLIEKAGIKGTLTGVLIWFYERNKILWVNIEGIMYRKSQGIKSVRFDDDCKDDKRLETYAVDFVVPVKFPKMNLQILNTVAEEKYNQWLNNHKKGEII